MQKGLVLVLALVFLSACGRQNPSSSVAGGANVLPGSNYFVMPANTRYGIGAVVRPEGDGIVVSSVFPGSPAFAVGLREGDRITTVNGAETRQLAFSEVVIKLGGERGSVVTVGVARSLGPMLATNLSLSIPRTFLRY